MHEKERQDKGTGRDGKEKGGKKLWNGERPLAHGESKEKGRRVWRSGGSGFWRGKREGGRGGEGGGRGDDAEVWEGRNRRTGQGGRVTIGGGGVLGQEREPKKRGNLVKLCRARARSLELLIFNEEFLVSASHQLALTTSLPFVHTARRSYRLNGAVKFSE